MPKLSASRGRRGGRGAPIASAVAAEAFGLSPTFAGFTAAMLSLGGYDALRLIEGKWNKRFEQASDTLAGEEGARPGDA